jgi:RNA polymerase-binding transcription factor DksA
MLVGLRRKLADNVSRIETEALRTGGESVGELSDAPLEHLADRGSESFAKDLMISILQNSEAEVHDIDTALVKLDGGTYGACETCAGQIAMGRLKALPFARLCIECKQAEESKAQEA